MTRMHQDDLIAICASNVAAGLIARFGNLDSHKGLRIFNNAMGDVGIESLSVNLAMKIILKADETK